MSEKALSRWWEWIQAGPQEGGLLVGTNSHPPPRDVHLVSATPAYVTAALSVQAVVQGHTGCVEDKHTT